MCEKNLHHIGFLGETETERQRHRKGARRQRQRKGARKIEKKRK